MSVTEEVIRILQSRGRVSPETDEPGADITGLRAAVGELQEAVVKLAEEIDRHREQLHG
jgi:uncharacterized coiled-coil DUF342 family protein